MEKTKKKEISVIKILILLFLIYTSISFSIKLLYGVIFDVLTPTSNYISDAYHIVNDFFPFALMDGLVYVLSDFVGLFFGVLFLTSKRNFIKNNSYMIIFLLGEVILLLSWINDIFGVACNHMIKYDMLFWNLSSYLFVGVLLLLSIILYFIAYKNNFSNSCLHKKKILILM